MKDKIGFDTDKYLEKEISLLSKRIKKFQRLYLEFGGKLFSDFHAARVLPGYRPTTKIELLKKLGNIDLFYCVCADDIAKGKIRGDSGLTYDLQTLKDIEDIVDFGIKVNGIIITRYVDQEAALKFKKRLESLGFKAYFQYTIKGYPGDIEKILKAYKKQPYIKPTKKLVVVTGTGGGAGKMAFCLSQINYERKKKIKSGFAKCETFPIWNLSLNHPINIAYEASTADLLDVNMVDPFYKKAYGKMVINYNRDIENFDILKKLLVKITGEKNPFGYKSPTDMGVNMAKEGIIDDKICRMAAKNEIIRRYFRYKRERFEGKENQKTVDRIVAIMKKARLKPENRKVVLAARQAAKDAPKTGKGFNNVYCGAALELRDGKIIKGKNSENLHAESAVILNAIKILANIPDHIHLISPNVLREISTMKEAMKNKNSPSLSVSETLIALAASAAFSPTARVALDQLKNLKNCEMHSTILPSTRDEVGIRLLKINLTSDPKMGFSRFF